MIGVQEKILYEWVVIFELDGHQMFEFLRIKEKLSTSQEAFEYVKINFPLRASFHISAIYRADMLPREFLDKELQEESKIKLLEKGAV